MLTPPRKGTPARRTILTSLGLTSFGLTSLGSSALSAPALMGFLSVPAFAASDFWNKKEAAEWSEAELEQIRTKSPWAKKNRAELAGGGGGRSRGGQDASEGSGGRGGGGGGGGRGGRGGGGGGGGGVGEGAGVSVPQGPEVVVRWENARPVLAATKLKLPDDLADRYAISVTGLPPQMLAAMLNGGGRGRGREGAAEAAPEDPAARQKAIEGRLLHSVTLSAKGRDPENADLVRQAFQGQTLIFGFPRQAFPLAATDKDVQFVMKLGPLTIKAKFEPKEMLWKGELAV